MAFKEFLDAYVEILLQDANASVHDPDEEIDRIDLTEDCELMDFEKSARDAIRADCREFYDKAGDRIDGREEEAASDFYLTRNESGAGFWDGDWPEPDATELTDLSKSLGGQQAMAYLDEDGEVVSIGVYDV